MTGDLENWPRISTTTEMGDCCNNDEVGGRTDQNVEIDDQQSPIAAHNTGYTRERTPVGETTTEFRKLAVQDRKRRGLYGSEAFGLRQGTMQSDTVRAASKRQSLSRLDASNGSQSDDGTADSPPQSPIRHQGNQHDHQHSHAHVESSSSSDSSTTAYLTGTSNQCSTSNQFSQNQVAAQGIIRQNHPYGQRVQVPLASNCKSPSPRISADVNKADGASAGLPTQGPIPSATRPPFPHTQNGNFVGLNNNKFETDLDRVDQGNTSTIHSYPVVLSDAETDSTHQSDDSTHTIMSTDSRGVKRKHACIVDDLLPPRAFVWRRSSDPNFTAFRGFLLYPELCFMLASHLPTQDLISLYAISRDFHVILNTRFTTVCMTIAREKAPESARAFHYRSYRQYCRSDPAHGIAQTDPKLAAQTVPRMIPSLRWVQFVLFREKVVHELLAVLCELGLPLPPKSSRALKRMWYLMDIPDNPRRIGAVHNEKLVSNADLYLMFAFMVKLDMLCNDPLGAEKNDGLRKLMLSQEDGLLTVLLVAKRLKWRRRGDLLMAWIKHSCEIAGAQDPTFDPVAFGASTIFGVPIRQAGIGKYEYWGKLGHVRHTDPLTAAKQHWQVLLRPDQLVMREAVRRGLRFKAEMLRDMLYGYVDAGTYLAPTPHLTSRRIPEWHDEEYDIDSLVGGVQALSVDQGGDPLLDLGPTREDTASCLMVTETPRERMTQEYIAAVRQDEDRFLKLCQIWALREMVKVGKDDPIRHDELMEMP